MRPKIGAAKLPMLPTGKWLLPMGTRLFFFFCGEISMDTSIRSKELPMTVPEVSSNG